MNAAEREMAYERFKLYDYRLRNLRGQIGCLLMWLVIPTLLIVVGMIAYRPIRTLTTFSVFALLIYLSLSIFNVTTNWRDAQKRKKWLRDVYRPQWREALEDGQVVIEHIEPTEVIEVFDEYPLECHYALCAVSEDQVICYMGFANIPRRHIHPPSATNWPNSCFEVVRTARHNLMVGTFCYGTRKEPVRTYKGERWAEALEQLDEDGAILMGTPQSVVDQIIAVWE